MFALTGVLVDIVTEDFKKSLSQLFTPAWEKGAAVISELVVTTHDYLSESRSLLDPYFFDRLAGMVRAPRTMALARARRR